MADEWTPRRLADFAVLRRGISYKSDQLEGDGSLFITIKCFEKGGGFREEGLKSYSGPKPLEYELHGGELLIANTDLTRDASIVGAPALAPPLATCFSMDVSKVDLDLTVADARFLFHRMLQPDVRAFMQARSGGSTVLHLHVKSVPELRLLLPALPEQRRIAEILDTVDEAIRRTEQVVAKLQQMKQGLLHDLLTRGIDENGELRPPPEEAPHLYKDSPLGLIPKAWGFVRAEQYCCSVADGTHDTPSPSSSGRPLITSKNLKDGKLDLSDTYMISEADYRLVRSRSWVEEGDILFGMIGTIGNPVVLRHGQTEIAVKNVGVFRLGGDIELALWLAMILDSELIRRQVREVLAGSTQKFVGLGTLRSLLIPTPSRNEMDSICKTYGLFSERIDSETKDFLKLHAFKTGLMHDLLTGRVRVSVPKGEA